MPNPTALTPYPVTITKIVDETSDVKTFTVEFDDPEIMRISVTNRAVCMLSYLARASPPFPLHPRRPKLSGTLNVSAAVESCTRWKWARSSACAARTGTGSLETMKGRTCFSWAAASRVLRSLIDFALSDHYRKYYGRVEILYGSRSYDDLCFKSDLFERWPTCQYGDILLLTVEMITGKDIWACSGYVEEVAPSPEKQVPIIAGPPS